MIELLVVAAIAVVLISLLLPVVSLARQAAHGARCAGNLRQCAMAVVAYAGENRGLLPHSWIETMGPLYGQPHAWGVGGFKVNWASAVMLGELLNSEEAQDRWTAVNTNKGKRPVALCPADRRPTDGTTGRRLISYGANRNVMKAMFFDGTNTYEVFHIGSVTERSRTIVFCDANNPTWRPDLANQITTDDMLTGPFIPDSGFAYAVRWTTARHGGTNVAFLDGHVEKSQDPRQPYLAGTWKASR